MSARGTFARAGVIVGLVLAAMLYFPALGALPFHDKGEPREALSLQAQMRTGDWVLPLTGGTTVPSKPPLFRWLGGMVAVATGRVDEWAARLPSAVLATATVLVVAGAAGARFGPMGAAVTALSLATTWTWIGAARTARVDMTLTACLTVSLLALERACRTATPVSALPALLLAYVSAALAVLAKGPVGVAIPTLVGLVYLTLRRDLRRLRRMHLTLGVLLVLAIAGSWYGLAAWQGGEAFVDRQLRHENLARFLGGARETSHRHPFYYYGPAFLLGFMPWTPLLVPVVALLVAQRGRLDDRRLLFPLVWLAVVIGFYSLAAGKRSIYVLSAYPAAALLVGALFAPDLPGRTAIARTAGLLRILAWAVLIVVVGGGVLVLGAGADLTAVTGWLHSQDREAVAHVVRLALEHRSTAALCVGVLAVPLVVAVVALHTDRPVCAVTALGALACLIAMGVVGVVQPQQAAHRTLKAFAREVNARVPSDAEVRFAGPPNGGMRFYLDRDAPSATSPAWQASDPAVCRYLLVWKSRWRRMRPEMRARLQPLRKSVGRGPEGDDRLVLVRARSKACAADRAAGPLQTTARSCEHSGHDDCHLRHLGRFACDRASRHLSPAHRGAVS